MVGAGAYWFTMIPFFLIYLVAFGLFAGVAALAKLNWRIAGSAGVVTAMALMFVRGIQVGTFDQMPLHIFLPALVVLFLANLRWLWPRRL